MLIVYSTTHAVLNSKKDEMAVVAVGSALSNANIVLQLQNIKTSFFITPVSFVAMCVQVMVEFFSGGKTNLSKWGSEIFFFFTWLNTKMWFL